MLANLHGVNSGGSGRLGSIAESRAGADGSRKAPRPAPGGGSRGAGRSANRLTRVRVESVASDHLSGSGAGRRAGDGAAAGAAIAGSTVAAGSAILLAQFFDLPFSVLLSLAPKSTTAPVALGISEAVGGIPTLTAVLVILTGIIGAITVTPLMNILSITDWQARGFAVGVAAHGIGTARAFKVNPIAGAYAGIAMALNALLTSLIVPILLKWLT